MSELARRNGVEGLTIGSAGNFVLEVVRFDGRYPVTKKPFPLEFLIARIGSSGREIIGLLMDGSLVKTDLEGRTKALLRSYSHIRSLALARDGKHLAICGAYAVQSSPHGHMPVAGDRRYGIAVVNVPSNTAIEVRVFEHASELGRCGDISWSPSGKQLVFDYDGKLYLHSLSDRQTAYLLDGSLPAWHPDGRWIAFREPKGTVQLVEESGKRARGLIDRKVLGGLRWSPDGHYLAFGEAVSGGGHIHSRLSVLRFKDSAVVTIRASINPEVGRDEGWLFMKSSGQP